MNVASLSLSRLDELLVVTHQQVLVNVNVNQMFSAWLK